MLGSTTHVVRSRYSVDLGYGRISSRNSFWCFLTPTNARQSTTVRHSSLRPPPLLSLTFLRYLALLFAIAEGFLIPVGGVAGPLEVVLERLVDHPAEVM